MKENNAWIEREMKNKGKSERGRGAIAECIEKPFTGYLVIGFIIQVHDFNFSLLLSKADGAAGGRLVVSWITAYEMRCSNPAQCLNDIIGIEMCREEGEQSIHSLAVSLTFNQQKLTSMHCL